MPTQNAKRKQSAYIFYIGIDRPTKLNGFTPQMFKQIADPYTEYENIKDSQQIQESVSGKYAGVGLVISNNINANGFTDSTTSKLNQKLKKNKNGVTVVGSFEGYAYDAGMRVGDRLLRVDGKDISRMGVDEVRSLLRGMYCKMMR